MRTVTLHSNPLQERHAIRGHPERPDRVAAILNGLRVSGTLERLRSSSERAATTAELELVHSPAHVEHLQRLDERGGGAIDPDTSVVPGSFAAAVSAAGAVLAAVDEVAGGAADAAFCVVRPPGHHATRERAMGFCLFNNVAIAAEYARRRHDLEHVAIVDFDVHHGNGTQEIFWNDPAVLYLSLHQYPFYPGTGDWREAGGDAAPGTAINVPLPAGSGDLDYLRTFDRLFLPLIRRFRPQLLAVSAGYDAHRADPLAQMALSTEAYGALMRRIRAVADEVAEGRIVAALEGGYDLAALAASVEASVQPLLDPSASFEPAPPAGARIETYLEGLRHFHRLD